MGSIADDQISADLHAASHQAIDFREDARRIEHHAAGDDRLHAGTEMPLGISDSL